MNRKLTLILALALLVSIVGMPAGAAPSQQKLYLRSNGASACADQVLTLSTRRGGDESVCGYRNGAPFGEVYEQTGIDDGTKYFTGTDGLPVTVDATRDVPGTIAVGAYLSGVGGGVGKLVLDVELTAVSGNSTVTLGSTTVEQDLDPAKDVHELPFTIDVDDAVNGQELTSLSLGVDVRGLHMGHGFLTLDGMSHFTLPITVEDTTT